MRQRTLAGVMVGLSLAAALPAAEDFLQLTNQAESLIAEGSYARAHTLYASVDLTLRNPDDRRWVEFRRADTQWRSLAATERPDTSEQEAAREALERMLRATEREADQDRTWAEIQESLGDFWWTQRRERNWSQAWPHYERALDWWAGQSDLDRARERYLSIVRRCARPSQAEPYGRRGDRLPLPILQNALEIAVSDQDRAWAHYLIATTLQSQGGDWEQQARVPGEYRAALDLGRGTDWYDDALFQYAHWMEQRGRLVPDGQGGYRNEPDFVEALKLYERLVNEFARGESRYLDQARRQIRNITGADLRVTVSEIFLPDSELRAHLHWRNVKRVTLALYAVNLTRDVALEGSDDNRAADWLHSMDPAGLQPVREWTHDTRDAGNHRPGNDTIRFEERLSPGAYLLVARGGGQTARDLVLVTDAALVLKTSGRQALVYVCNALTGAPLAAGEIALEARWRDNNQWRRHAETRQADRDGLATFDLPLASRNLELFVAARTGDRQAFATANTWRSRADRDSWKIHAFTDRPAYRPGETVHWKFTARQYDGSVHSTPANQAVQLEIVDPRGTRVYEDTTTLNSFGSAWGSLELTAEMALGEYQILFHDADHKQSIGGAPLFRLEEYKLPEFKVTVTTPTETATNAPNAGRKKTFRLGDTVEAVIQAEYYFGGPVADAELEVVVYQQPFWIHWPQPREFPWFYTDMEDGHEPWGRRRSGRGPIVKRETLRTDAAGQAVVRFDTPAHDAQDYEYRIEARVTDASRREIIGSDTVRVTRQRYYVHARASHNLYRPQDRVTVRFQAQDANRNPVAVEGTVRVTRQYWWEVWLQPDGTEVKGEALKRLRARHPVWPPPPERPDQKGWKLKFRGYEQEDVLTRALTTDTNGVAALSFEPDRIGYYHVEWTSEDPVVNRTSEIVNRIRAATTVWVTDSEATDIGYRHGGVEIIADRDTFRSGEEAPIMLVANSPDRHVLFTVEGEDLQSHRLVHLTGNVKLIHLLIGEQHVPNVYLGATLISDREMHVDTKQIVVPPTKNFLQVDVQPDREAYRPREEGTLTVTARDDAGNPVQAEVALSLVDESVFYIQHEYAGDPRQFFFGDKRRHRIQTHSTMNRKRYVQWVEGGEDGLREAEDRAAMGFEDDGSGRPLAEAATLGLARQSAPALPPPAAAALAGAAPEARGMITGESFFAADAGAANLEGSDDSGPAVTVRSDFRSTIAWLPDLRTDEEGTARVDVTYPDSVTGWRATARVATEGNQFGMGDTRTRTRQPLIVRLQAPRFLVVGDTVTLSAIVNNNTREARPVRVSLEADGVDLDPHPRTALPDDSSIPGEAAIRVAAQSEARVDWSATVREAGPVTLRAIARGTDHSDAMEKVYPAVEHGIEQFVSKAGKIRSDEVIVTLDIPGQRKPDSTTLTVQVTPSLAATMLDALPYLIDYPYGCTEQTLSRFLPAVITARTLKDLDLQPENVMQRIFGGIETNSATATHPRGRRDLANLDDMTQSGLDRLYDFQHNDGGWGWWKQGDSDPWMTAYVVWGLTLARQAGVEVRAGVVRSATEFLDRQLVEEEQHPDMQAWMLHALAVQKAAEGESGLSRFQQTAFENLWNRKDQLNAYTRALYALAAHHFNKPEEAGILVANLENGVIRDDQPDTSVLIQPASGSPAPAAGQPATAHWGEDGLFRRWSDGGVEATAFALRALLAIDPDHSLVEPVTHWLIKNRRGAQWSNTRDTAIVVLALNEYLRASGELQSDLEYEVLVNGQTVAQQRVSGAEAIAAPSRFRVETSLVRDGGNEIRIRRTGAGPLYFAVEASYFSLEEPIPAAGNELFVKRQYYKLVGRPTLLKGYVYDKLPLLDGDTVASGQRVETVVTLETKNHYEYLVFEDLKPAGFEAVQVRSGEPLHARELKRSATPSSNPGSDPDRTGRSRWVHQELRDRKVALFIDKLPEGVWQLRYEFRAEVPGRFHALPVLGHAMYVPEIRCNGEELRVVVTDPD